MNEETLKKRYIAGALSVCGIISAMVMYAVLVEYLAAMGNPFALQPPVSHAVKYVFYSASAAVIPLLGLVTARLGRHGPGPEETLAGLLRLAMVRAALCEAPALLGLVLFVLTGLRADFYMLLLAALALEIYHFPRLDRWRETLRTAHGLQL